MKLETMQPTPTFDAEAHAETVETWAALADRVTVTVWGGDWCGDCRAVLPDFAAAIEAAGVPADAVTHHPVEKADDGSKVGEGVEAYGVELIPTIVVEVDGEEVARFVESAPVPAAQYLAERLRDADV
jgi:thiol-disulfide isomerase/thioredoxin